MFRRERAVLLTKGRRDLFDDVKSKNRRWCFLALLAVVALVVLIVVSRHFGEGLEEL